MIPMIVQVGFKHIFPNEKAPQSHRDYLVSVPSLHVLHFLSIVNSILHFEGSKQDVDILLFIIGRFSLMDKMAILRSYEKTKTDYGGSIQAFSTWAITNMIMDELVNFRDLEISDTTPEEEQQILKAYLLYAERLAAQQEASLPLEKGFREISFESWAWSILPQQMDFNTRSIAVLQLLKAGIVVYHLHGRPLYQSTIQSYFIKKGFKDIKEWFASYFNLFFFKFSEINSENSNLVKLRPAPNHLALIEHLTADPKKFRDNRTLQVNLNGLKSYPLVSVGDGSYLVTNWNYFFNRMYDSLLFDLWTNSEFSTANFGDFKSWYGKSIAEDLLFKRIVQQSFSSPHNKIQFDNGDPGHPDGIVRVGNRVFVIEFKDTQMPSDVVDSKNSADVLSDVVKKWVMKENGRETGIHQVAKAIQQMVEENDPFHIGSTRKTSSLTIYPLIVYTGHYYSIPGINKYLANLLNQQITSISNNFKHIYPLVMIPLDFFFCSVNTLAKGEIKLQEVLRKYFEFLKRNEKMSKRNHIAMLNEQYSFLHFLYTQSDDRYREMVLSPDAEAILDIFDLPIEYTGA